MRENNSFKNIHRKRRNKEGEMKMLGVRSARFTTVSELGASVV